MVPAWCVCLFDRLDSYRLLRRSATTSTSVRTFIFWLRVSPLSARTVDLAQGHITSLAALERDETFKANAATKAGGFGGSGGRFKSYKWALPAL